MSDQLTPREIITNQMPEGMHDLVPEFQDAAQAQLWLQEAMPALRRASQERQLQIWWDLSEAEIEAAERLGVTMGAYQFQRDNQRDEREAMRAHANRMADQFKGNS